MPKPKRHILEEMAESTEKAIQTFPEEHYLVTNIGGLYIEVMVLIEKLKHISCSAKLAVWAIGSRNFRILQCASHSIYNGFYDVSMILLRVAYENELLMRYLTDNEEESRKWLQGKRFKPNYLRKKAKDDTDLYGFLSKYFTHANVESFFSGVVYTLNGKTFSARCFPEFDKQQAQLCFYTYIITAWLSLIIFQYAFRDFLWKDEEWKNRFAHWNEIILSYIDQKILKIKHKQTRQNE